MNTVALIHGWAAKPTIWNKLVAALPGYDIHNIVLPAYGVGGDWHNPVDYLAQQLPPKCHLVGWSLGGHLAMQLAQQLPEKIKSVTTIATAPQFVANDTWPWAMDAKVFDAFAAGLLGNYGATLKRFTGLQAQGDAESRVILRELKTHIFDEDEQALAASLAWLKAVDQTELWQTFATPALHLFAEHDELVPVAAAKHCANSKVLAGAAHAPMLSAPQVLADELRSFWGTND